MNVSFAANFNSHRREPLLPNNNKVETAAERSASQQQTTKNSRQNYASNVIKIKISTFNRIISHPHNCTITILANLLVGAGSAAVLRVALAQQRGARQPQRVARRRRQLAVG